MHPIHRTVLAAVAAATLLTGCFDQMMNVRPEKRLADDRHGRIHFNAADYRAIVSVPRGDGHGGRFITCIEPSPDIARVFGTAFGAGADVREPNSGTQVSLAVAMSRAASAAQLGERLATIQLLRDVLYRACEAYANGALDATSYSVIMSRMDDMIVTMLLGELTAGNFGRKLTSLSAGAGGTGLVGGTRRDDLADALAAEAEAEADFLADAQALDSARAELESICNNARQDAIADADAEQACSAARVESGSGDSGKGGDGAASNDGGGDDPAPDEGDFEQAVADVEEAGEEQAESEAALYVARARTRAAARAVTGGIEADVSDKQAELLTTLARKYLENVNFDALMVACVHALHEHESVHRGEGENADVAVVNHSVVAPGAVTGVQGSALSSVCHQMMTDGPFAELMHSSIRMVEARKRLAELERQRLQKELDAASRPDAGGNNISGDEGGAP